MAGARELTAEEKGKLYSKYYYRPHAGASPELAPLLKDHKPIDPSEALSIEKMNDLLEPGYLPGETGYCTLADGGAYVAVRHPMPGVTAEMVNWWFAWHGLEDLEYSNLRVLLPEIYAEMGGAVA